MNSANTFTSMKPDFKESYGDGNTKKFKKTRKALSGIGLSLHKASKDPKKYMDEQSDNIEKYKGVTS